MKSNQQYGSVKLESVNRDIIVNEITNLANLVSSITGYATENLLVEVSKITRDQLANEFIKPDFGLFRVHIFKYLIKYTELAEQRSRILSPLLIELYKDEVQHTSAPKFQNILRRTEQQASEENDKQNKSDVTETSKPEEHSLKALMTKPKDAIAAIKAILAVFSKFHSPKTVFREPELREMYYELLLSTDSELQEGALDCLLTYKEPFLVPYSKHLKKLMNEKQLSDELVIFTVDEQNSVVAAEHRTELMPYVMRILLGRFHAKSVVRGKQKRISIFRFLASCKAYELEIFVRLLLSSFISTFDLKSDNVQLVLDSIVDKYDPTHTFSLYKIQSALGIVKDMFIDLTPSLSAGQIDLFFDIALICAVLINQAFAHVSNVTAPIANLLKSLRKSVFEIFTQFYRSFLLHHMTTNKVNCLFTRVLEPMIHSYNKSLVNAPVPVVQMSVAKLFTFWSEFPRYFLLLNYKFSGALREETPISLLCNTLQSAGTTRVDQTKIIKAILNLLKSRKEDEDYIFEELSFDDLSQTVVPYHESANGFGSRILLSQIHKILTFLSEKIPKVAKDKSKIPYSYLDILNRISLFVDDKEMGEKFATTFLSYLGNNRLVRNRDRMTELFNTMTALSKYLTDPLAALRKVTRLLSKLTDRSTRDAFVGFILALRNNTQFPACYIEHVGILADLESYDKSRIEEPDLDRRFQAFERIDEVYGQEASNVFGLEIIQLFAHSHAFCVINSTDIALRKTSSNALRRLIKYIADRVDPKEAEYLLFSHIVQLMLDGLNSTNEICRTEFVYCLADLIHRFPNNVHFAQLQPLNKGWRCEEDVGQDDEELGDAEQETNFFENAVHIQIHRRQRAFFKLTEQLKSDEVIITADILLRYVFPIFKPYLLETVSKTSALSDQSIKLFSVILERTSWRKYQRFLESILRQIDETEKTKGVVRVLIAVLGAFHFDVANLPRIEQSLGQVVLLNKTENVANGINDDETKAKIDEKKIVSDISLVNGMRSQESVVAFGIEDEELEMTVEEEEELDKQSNDDDDDEKEVEDNENEKMEVDENEDEEKEVTEVKSFEEDKRKILDYMVIKVIPRLRQALRNSEQQNHKKSHQNDYEIDEELLTRVPIVLAMSKVIKRLPNYVLKENLNGMISAMQRLLLSRSSSVRQSARKIMGQFVQILGSEHLPHIIKELRQSLLRGYQLYVMIFTVHTIIAALEHEMNAGDLDSCFEDVFEICKLELVGDTAEAKKNANTVPEAKSNKSVDTFILLGKFITAKSMTVALQMVKETIDKRPTGPVVKKFSELLRGFSTGLHSNKSIDVNILLEFIRSVLHQYLTEMLQQQQHLKSAESAEKEMLKKGHRPPSCLLLPPEPKRIGELVKHSLKSKVTIFVEFSLQLLADVLKARPVVKEVGSLVGECGDLLPITTTDINKSNQALLENLNKFVPALIDCLKLKLIKVIALSLRCLSIFMRYRLSNIQSNVQTIMDRLFVILSEYVGIGQSHSAVAELNQLLFKCFTQLIRDFPILSITPRRVELLLNYAEADILDTQKQATSFLLIKAILTRKIEDEKVENIIEYLSELLVTSLNMNTRIQCRQVVLIYLTSHPSGLKKLNHWLEFFTNQTEYEYESGRLSALEMLNSIFDSCSLEAVNRLSLFIFMKLSSRLMNDESDMCRKYVSLVLQNLLTIVDESSFNDLFFVTKDWLESKKSSVQLLALKVFSEFAHSQSNDATKNISNVNAKLYEVAETLVGRLTSTGVSLFEEWSEPVVVAYFDFLIAFSDYSPLKMVKILSNLADQIASFFEVLNDALRCVSSLNIQMSSSNFLSRLLMLPSSKSKSNFYFDVTNALSTHFPRSLTGVCLAICAQIRHLHYNNYDVLADQTVKNMTIMMSKLNASDFDGVCIRLAGICWREISKEKDTMSKRERIFKITSECIVKADTDKMESLCSKILPLLYREMNRKSDKYTEELCQLANKVVTDLRLKIGEKKLSAYLVTCHKDAFKRAKERKEKLKARAVLNPEAEAISKQKRHERKRLAKRRKLDELRPHRVVKRRRKAMNPE